MIRIRSRPSGASKCSSALGWRRAMCRVSAMPRLRNTFHQRCPGRGRVVLVHRFLGGLQVVHDLPDPGGDAKGAAHERQCGIEYLSSRHAERSPPALLHVGHRLAGCQFDQGVGIGLEQRGQCVMVPISSIGERDGAAACTAQSEAGPGARHRPRRRRGVGKHVLGVIEPLCLGQPGQNRFAQR